MYVRTTRNLKIDAMVAWGRNKRTTSFVPVPGGVFFYPGNIAQALLAEATVHVAGRHALITRIERADKDELFPERISGTPSFLG